MNRGSMHQARRNVNNPAYCKHRVARFPLLPLNRHRILTRLCASSMQVLSPMLQTIWTINNIWERIRFEVGLVLSALFFIGVRSHLSAQYLSSILSIIRQVTPDDDDLTLQGLRHAEDAMHAWQVADLAAAADDGEEDT